MFNTMFDEQKEAKYFKEITDFKSYSVKHFKEIKRFKSLQKAEAYIESKYAKQVSTMKLFYEFT